uniref:Ig-like domain-containing protein n=1 Tax=Astatotilapia calliptera TaxID=8154 RepID=A0A3P8PKS9_ASTCA
MGKDAESPHTLCPRLTLFFTLHTHSIARETQGLVQGICSRIKVVVLEGSDAILPCSLNTKESVEQELFDWMKKAPNKQEVFMYNGGNHYNNGLSGQDEHFRGRVSHFPLELQFGNASIIIRNTMVADSGNYTCDFPRLRTQAFNIRLVVGEYFSFEASEKNLSLNTHFFF